MARPIKSGLDYFPLDVNMNNKMVLIEMQFGCVGFAVMIKLYQTIYAGHGYYCDWDEESVMLFCYKTGVEKNAVNSIVKEAIRLRLFDEDLYKKYSVLSSKGVQERYFEVAKRRKTQIYNAELMLIDVEEYGVKLNTDTINVDINTQSKGNKTKQNKIKQKDSNAAAKDCNDDGQTPPTLKQVSDYCKKRSSNINPNLFYEYYASSDWKDSNGKIVKNWKQRIISWEKKENTPRLYKSRPIRGPDGMAKNLSVPMFIKKGEG